MRKLSKNQWILLFAALFSLRAEAYLSMMDTGELLEPGKYNLVTESQFVTSGSDGLNLRLHFDQRDGESTQYRFLLGTGVNAMQAGLRYKWVPYPDFENQPAIGLIGGILFTRLDGGSLMAINLRAFTSKKFEFDYGDIIPYGGILAGVEVTKKEDLNPAQFFAGAKFKSLNWEELYFYGEIGAQIVDSFSYISLGIQWQMDESLFQSKP